MGIFGHGEIPLIFANAIANNGTRRAIHKDGMGLAVFVRPKAFRGVARGQIYPLQPPQQQTSRWRGNGLNLWMARVEEPIQHEEAPVRRRIPL